ncbi:MAG TPA: peptidylprolyl isomerase, partial [Alphaproteobacteria bacterium]|nr:peptidylprolyl isomerase [Alphaproteobacteria bacterium]
MSFAANAAQVGIIATVNNDIVTTHELQQRMEMIMSGNNIPRTEEAMRSIAPEILRGIIDDKLRIQAAESIGIKLTDEEIRRATATVAGNNNMSVEQFTGMLQQQGIEEASLREQIRAELMWQKYTESRIVPKLNILEGEIDRLQNQLNSNANQMGYLVAEIFLPVDQAEDDAKTKAFGDELIKKLAAGTKFSALARSFSGSASASRSGDLGWQSLEQMPDEISRIVKVMRAGQVSKPMRTLRGYHILFLRETRTMTPDNIPSRDEIREASARQQVD